MNATESLQLNTPSLNFINSFLYVIYYYLLKLNKYNKVGFYELLCIVDEDEVVLKHVNRMSSLP